MQRKTSIMLVLAGLIFSGQAYGMADEEEVVRSTDHRPTNIRKSMWNAIRAVLWSAAGAALYAGIAVIEYNNQCRKQGDGSYLCKNKIYNTQADALRTYLGSSICCGVVVGISAWYLFLECCRRNQRPHQE